MAFMVAVKIAESKFSRQAGPDGAHLAKRLLLSSGCFATSSHHNASPLSNGLRTPRNCFQAGVRSGLRYMWQTFPS